MGRGEACCQFLPSVFVPLPQSASWCSCTLWTNDTISWALAEWYHTCEEPQLLFVVFLAVLGSVAMPGGGTDFYT